MADELERWLAVADNRGEWERLRRALQLERGFGLFVVDVPDAETEGRVVELLACERPQLVVLDARSSGEQAPVKELMRTRQSVVALRSVEASRRDVEALERCLIQFNARRDRIAVREHVLVIMLRRDEIARMIDVAPDLYSVHRSRFRFARLVRPRPTPMWLLSDEDFAVVLEGSGRASAGSLGAFEPPDAGQWIEARILAHNEGLRCLVVSRSEDLASALESPSFAVADLMSKQLRAAQAVGSHHLVHLCSVALTWVHLQQSNLIEARSALDVATNYGRPDAVAPKMLELYLAYAEGTLKASDLVDEHMVRSLFLLRNSASISTRFGLAEIAWEFGSGNATGWFRLGVQDLESLENRWWRFDPILRSLPDDLIDAAITEQDRMQVIAWLRDRPAWQSSWDGAWVVYLMLARALGNSGHIAELIDIGRGWLGEPTRRDVYEVWRPLVDIHAEVKDTAQLEQLTRMPLAPDATERFGPRLPAALHVVADVLDRGFIELPSTERDDLLVRAAAREALPLDMRLGWWAIELALAKR